MLILCKFNIVFFLKFDIILINIDFNEECI